MGVGSSRNLNQKLDDASAELLLRDMHKRDPEMAQCFDEGRTDCYELNMDIVPHPVLIAEEAAALFGVGVVGGVAASADDVAIATKRTADTLRVAKQLMSPNGMANKASLAQAAGRTYQAVQFIEYSMVVSGLAFLAGLFIHENQTELTDKDTSQNKVGHTDIDGVPGAQGEEGSQEISNGDGTPTYEQAIEDAVYGSVIEGALDDLWRHYQIVEHPNHDPFGLTETPEPLSYNPNKPIGFQTSLNKVGHTEWDSDAPQPSNWDESAPEIKPKEPKKDQPPEEESGGIEIDTLDGEPLVSVPGKDGERRIISPGVGSSGASGVNNQPAQFITEGNGSGRGQKRGVEIGGGVTVVYDEATEKTTYYRNGQEISEGEAAKYRSPIHSPEWQGGVSINGKYMSAPPFHEGQGASIGEYPVQLNKGVVDKDASSAGTPVTDIAIIQIGGESFTFIPDPRSRSLKIIKNDNGEDKTLIIQIPEGHYYRYTEELDKNGMPVVEIIQQEEVQASSVKNSAMMFEDEGPEAVISKEQRFEIQPFPRRDEKLTLVVVDRTVGNNSIAGYAVVPFGTVVIVDDVEHEIGKDISENPAEPERYEIHRDRTGIIRIEKAQAGTWEEAPGDGEVIDLGVVRIIQGQNYDEHRYYDQDGNEITGEEADVIINDQFGKPVEPADPSIFHNIPFSNSYQKVDS